MAQENLSARKAVHFSSGHSINLSAIRKDFPVLSQMINGHPLVYLDNAASTQKPMSVIQKMQTFYEHDYANVHRGAYELSSRATDEYEEARRKIVDFINAAGSKNIIFTKNGSEAINLVAYSWGRHFLNEGDEIVLTEMEHHSNLIPWQLLAEEKGLTLRPVPIRADGTLDMEVLKKVIFSKTKLVAVTHVSNVLGTINPVAEIARLAHSVGAKILVDGAQSVPHFSVDVQA
ncbi:MAG TPA: aminotransferase class V-fold PLP-dependent enzyme, partial [Bacteroidetes bacterium]|nr:aminotransferase class V-fold PLP-dependent enzyme [Bacteroidota bacterium]